MIRHRVAGDRSLDTIHDVLRDERRRRLVEHLTDCDPPVSLDELAAAVAARGFAEDRTDGRDEAANDVAITLHHVHLPRLEDADCLRYDAAEKTVTAVRTAELARCLGVADDT